MSGLLLAIVMIMTPQTPLLKSLNQNTAAEVMGITALVTVCTSEGKRLHTLPSHPTLLEPQTAEC